MTIKEIKEHSEFLYSKSSHYISTLFIITGTIIGTVNRFSYYIAMIIFGLLLMPLQFGQVKALLKASERKAKEVDTKDYLLTSLKQYPKNMGVFIGKTAFIIIIQIIILLAFMVISNATLNDVKNVIHTLVTGGENFILTQTEQGYKILVPAGMIIGMLTAAIVGIYLQIKLAFVYYFAVDQNFSLLESITASFKSLRGNTIKYIRVWISFLLPIIGTFILNYIATLALQNGFYELMKLLPRQVILIDCILRFVLALATTTIAVMFYKVKLEIALVTLYKDIVSKQ